MSNRAARQGASCLPNGTGVVIQRQRKGVVAVRMSVTW
jgi:hypothetical protein